MLRFTNNVYCRDIYSTLRYCNGRGRAQVMWMFARLNSKGVSRDKDKDKNLEDVFKVVLLLAIQEN